MQGAFAIRYRYNHHRKENDNLLTHGTAIDDLTSRSCDKESEQYNAQGSNSIGFPRQDLRIGGSKITGIDGVRITIIT